MTERQLTDTERDDWRRILSADKPASPLDDPNWIEWDKVRWDYRKRLVESPHDRSDYVRHARTVTRAREQGEH